MPLAKLINEVSIVMPSNYAYKQEQNLDPNFSNKEFLDRYVVVVARSCYNLNSTDQTNLENVLVTRTGVT